MNYEIQSRSDFLTGSYLTVKIPENEIDLNALSTIQTDCPDFILPFHHKSTDGYIELVYKVGTHCKLQYFSGDLTPEEYADLWQSILEPLLICNDWFMNPCSFVLKADYLYYDKNKKAVNYVYIPSVSGCSGYDAFYEMAVEVSKLMTVSDAVLENKVLRAIIKDFNPMEFLQMLKEHAAQCADSEYIEPITNKPDTDKQIEPEEQLKSKAAQPEALIHEYEEKDISLSLQESGEDIIIDIQTEKKTEKHKREKESGGYRLFSSKSRKKKPVQQAEKEKREQITEAKPKAVNKSETAQIVDNKIEIIDVTQITSLLSGRPGLRYVGHGQLPQAIQVGITEGEIFTIGRFDAAIGRKQSSFEFDKKTKAVSRRHAVIERSSAGYKITDLSSSAGTFISDKKLPPNTPFDLEAGCKVSFGNSGADYVWEIN